MLFKRERGPFVSRSPQTLGFSMAIWQFDLVFVEPKRLPRRIDDGHEVPELSVEKTEIATQWLIGYSGARRTLAVDWHIFGEEQGSRIDLSLNENKTAELSARIDARADSSEFIQSICDLCLLIGCVFFSTEKWSVIKPGEEEIKQALANSLATKYVRDPQSVLGGEFERLRGK